MANRPSTNRHRNSLTEHHEKGGSLAQRVLVELDDPRLHTHEDLRQAIERLPDTTRLQVTVADLWLNLSKYQSQQRRQQEPPPSPFTKEGKELVGVKADIRDWDNAWLQIEHLRLAAKIYALSGTGSARAQAVKFRERLAVLTAGNGVVMGFVDQMAPNALAHALTQPERLQVVDLTMDQVLGRRWWDKADQLRVLDVYTSVLAGWRAEVVAFAPPDA
jgi:hypothetical protein